MRSLIFTARVDHSDDLLLVKGQGQRSIFRLLHALLRALPRKNVKTLHVRTFCLLRLTNNFQMVGNWGLSHYSHSHVTMCIGYAHVRSKESYTLIPRVTECSLFNSSACGFVHRFIYKRAWKVKAF